MLALKPASRQLLVAIVNGITKDPSLREDLMQEAIIHFWAEEQRRPGRTMSWYLQSCSFHLRHCLNSGRSIDSTKRRGKQVELPGDWESFYDSGWLQTEIPFPAQVEAREIVEMLPHHLTSCEQEILQCLKEDLGPGEIAVRLQLSHPTVRKYRRNIAAAASRLGVGP